MKRTAFNLLVSAVVLVIANGCSQKVSIRTLEPSEIERAAMTKKVSVAPFENDHIGLSNKIETDMVKQRIDGKEYFTVIGRKDFEKIIAEQKIQNSGLVEFSTAVEIGNLIGAEAIISGRVGDAALKETHFYEERSKCVDKKCKESVKYSVRCIKREVGLSAEIRMVDVSKGDIIYAESLSRMSEFKHCKDGSGNIPAVETALQVLAMVIADDFTHKLMPHYRYFEVVLLDESDIEYSSRQEELLEASLEYIKQSRLDKAEKLLLELIDSTKERSYVAFYNLGVIKEAQGAYNEARNYYKIADDLVIEPVSEVNEAYIRIGRIIEKSDKAKEQILR